MARVWEGMDRILRSKSASVSMEIFCRKGRRKGRKDSERKKVDPAAFTAAAEIFAFALLCPLGEEHHPSSSFSTVSLFKGENQYQNKVIS